MEGTTLNLDDLLKEAPKPTYYAEPRDVRTGIKEAQNAGLEVYTPADNVLTLDLDSSGAYAQYRDRLTFIQKYVSVVGINETTSKSGNKHVILTLGRHLTVPEKVALQGLLGSDFRREAFSLLRYLKGDQELSVLLFEKPGSGAANIPGLTKVNAHEGEQEEVAF